MVLITKATSEGSGRSDQKSDILPNWMAAHVHLKNEFTEDEKYHNLMSWLIFILCLNVSRLLQYLRS